MPTRICLLLLVLITGCFTAYSQGISDCKTCNTVLLKAKDIDTLSVDELRLLTNEIYARNGYRFSNDRYQNYFEDFGWYKPLSDNSQVKLNSVEEKNVKLLQDWRKVREEERKIILFYFKKLKQLAATNADGELQKLFAKTETPEIISIDEFKKVLSKIDFEDVHWYKNNGLHSVEVDNGFVKILHSFSVTNEEIVLAYNYMAHSEIMEEFGIFSDYMSEGEYAVWWVFSLENGEVVFKYIGAAG